MRHAKNHVRFPFVLFVLVLLLLIPGRSASAEDPAAESFSDPNFTMEMEPGWDMRPIRYKNDNREAELSIVVNQQLSAVLLPMVDKYVSKKKVKIAMEIGTCGISAGAISRKEVDMGGFCCPPGKIDRLPGLQFHTLGITPLLLLVHKDNPVDNVTLDEARKLFRGEVHNWSELGGQDLPVRPMGMLHCKKRPGHWRLILGSAKSFSPEFKVTGDIEDTINMVATTPGSIGFEIRMNMLKLGRADDLKVLMIDGHDPMDLARLRDNKYPFYRTMNVTTWKGRNITSPIADDLVRYLLKETRDVGKDQGIVPASELRNAGWKFRGSELIGEPGQ